jgi:coniferyl-aldehyde dehydrogenase
MTTTAAVLERADAAHGALTLRALFEAQRTAFAAAPAGHAERVEALRGLDRLLARRQHDIADAVSEDFGGRARAETLALELLPVRNEIRHACASLKRWMRPRRARVQWQCWPATARISCQPLGVVGIVSSWNYPVFLALAPLTAALAAGNHALVKTSELAPATAAVLQAIVRELFPPAYASIVTGGADTAAAFVRLPFDHLLFTGSARVGRLVMQAAAENLVPVTLELGGKSPAIVHPTYPLQTAAARIVTGKLYTAGQTCVAPDYVLVPAERRDAFVQAAAAAIQRMYPTLADNQDYTRIINPHHYARLSALLEDARRMGATVLQVKPPEEVCDARNRVFPPTLVTGVTPDMAIMREEIFGPILPVVEYGRVDEAIAFVNARPHPLALYYFDHDSQRVKGVLDRVIAGGVTVNDCVFHAGQTRLPFGGVGPSGMGRYHGFAGFQTFSRTTSVLYQRRWSALPLLRPPYGAAAKRILSFLLGG